MKERENLGSRLGFILLSAGCAIGLGNVWRFPYITGQYGGGFFVLIYLCFLCLMGIPIITMEYAVGRASHRSIYPAFKTLEKPGTKWHIWGWFAMAGNYVLLMYYSVISGWILYYLWLLLSGTFDGATTEKVQSVFDGMMGSPAILVGFMLLVVLMTMLICSAGLQQSVEKITMVMMIALILIMIALAIFSLMLPGGAPGLSFYLKPNLQNMENAGFGQVVYAALNQSFFTLSIGMGGMEIFGSYIDKKRSLLGEATLVAALDTFVALTAGLIIFPACFAYGIDVDAGPSLIFVTLPRVFSGMQGGRIVGSLFFLFLYFAALSTMIGVFENIVSFAVDLRGTSRKKSALVNGLILMISSIPCALGFNVWSSFQPLRAGNTIMDLEDFYVSNIALPVGSFIFILFCTLTQGWGYRNYLKEVNTGDGAKIAGENKLIHIYFRVILPILTGFLVFYGIATYF